MPGVIVADNDSLIRGVLRSLLTDVGQDVLLAGDGEEALRFARRMQACLVLLDLNMPRLNGLVTCEEMRGLPGYAGTPIAILTGVDYARTDLAALRAGATLVLRKPFQPAALLQRIMPYLKVDRATLARVRRSAAQAREITANPVPRTTGDAWDGVRDRDEPGRPAGMLDQGRQTLSLYR